MANIPAGFEEVPIVNGYVVPPPPAAASAPNGFVEVPIVNGYVAPPPEAGMLDNAISGINNFREGYGNQFADWIRGGLQAGAEVVGADDFRNWVIDAQRLADKRAEQKREQGGAYSAGEVTANIAPFLGIGSGANTVRAVAAAGGKIGAIQGAFEPSRDETEGLTDRALNTAKNAAGGYVTAGAIKGGFDVAGKTLKYGTELARKPLARALGINTQAVDDMVASQVKPTIGTASDRPTAKITDRFLSKFPGGAEVMRKSTDRTLDALSKQLDDLGAARGTSTQEAGAVIQKGAQNYVDRFGDVSSKLYERFHKFIPSSKQVSVDNVRAALDDELIAFQNNPELLSLAPKVVREMSESIQQGKTVPYQLLRRMRTSIGQKIARPGNMTGDEYASLKGLYGALTADMKSAASSQSPAALRAFERANSFHSAGMQHIEQNLKKIIDQGLPEQVYNYATQGTKAGGTRLAGIMKSLKPEQRDIVRGTVLKQLGTASPGMQDAAGDVFNIGRFLTEWNKISPEAKDALFSGKGTNRAALEKLARVVSRTKELERFANHSNTGQYLTMAAVLGGGAYLDERVLYMVPLAVGGATLMNNPGFVTWLSRGLSTQSGNMATHINDLARITASSPEIREDVELYLKRLSGITQAEK